MGVGAGIFYMAYDDINNGHRITVAANGVVSLNVNDTSDEKMKKNITSLADGAIDRIKQLRPVNFDWKKDSDLNGQSGFIAQEIKTVIPDLVQGEEYVEGSIESVGYSVNTTGIVAHLTKAVQELITKVETLEQDNIALRARVTNLEGN
jgi:cell division protein ZapA (FtsZ GTPase activity inhibitor)